MARSVLDVWNVSEAAFPTTGTAPEQLRFLLHYAVLAPSGHNTQPWLFHLGDDTLELYADRTRALPVADPENRELTIACGAALLNLRIALRHFGYTGIVDTFPDPASPDLLARVQLGKMTSPTAEEQALFQAIDKRATNRKPFEAREVPPALLAALQEAAREEGAWLHIVDGEDNRLAVADLIAEGDRWQWADHHFRRELAAWSHANRSRSHDGMPGYAFGMGDVASSLTPLVIRTFDLGEGTAAKDRQLATGSPVLAIVGTDDDTPQAWLAAGEALERLLLRACVEGGSISNPAFCTLSKMGGLTDLLMWLHERIEEKGGEVGKVYPVT